VYGSLLFSNTILLPASLFHSLFLSHPPIVHPLVTRGNESSDDHRNTLSRNQHLPALASYRFNTLQARISQKKYNFFTTFDHLAPKAYCIRKKTCRLDKNKFDRVKDSVKPHSFDTVNTVTFVCFIVSFNRVSPSFNHLMRWYIVIMKWKYLSMQPRLRCRSLVIYLLHFLIAPHKRKIYSGCIFKSRD